MVVMFTYPGPVLLRGTIAAKQSRHSSHGATAAPATIARCGIYALRQRGVYTNVGPCTALRLCDRCPYMRRRLPREKLIRVDSGTAFVKNLYQGPGARRALSRLFEWKRC